MKAVKIAITLAEDLVNRLDELVRQRQYPSRSRAVQEAVRDKLERLDRTRLARECEKLDSRAEQEMADEGINSEIDEWPEY
jgi:metal-responsive CopG/Arc/MetJ family transcriptional regulator